MFGAGVNKPAVEQGIVHIENNELVQLIQLLFQCKIHLGTYFRYHAQLLQVEPWVVGRYGFHYDGQCYFLAHFTRGLPRLALVFYVSFFYLTYSGVHQVHVYQQTYIHPINFAKTNLVEL
jgi:hypothetical protein